MFRFLYISLLANTLIAFGNPIDFDLVAYDNVDDRTALKRADDF
jgi:hypothetical protein